MGAATLELYHVPHCMPVYTAREIRSIYMSAQGKVAKWWIPDDVAFVKEIPHTATGKVSKLKLRELFKDFRFDNSKL